MTKEETLAFNQMINSIANNKNKKFMPTENPSEFLNMVPIGDVLAELRKFINFVKSKNVEPN